jgi:hypothetical protein
VKQLLINFMVLAIACSGLSNAQEPSYTPRQISEECFRLGAAAAFSEMVRFGVKKLALSTPLLPGEMRGHEEALRQTIDEQGVQAYLETDFLVTDLFAQDIAEGKHLMVIYTGNTLDEYLALKQAKDELVESGRYSGEARKNIAREFGRMLGYPDLFIEERLQ